MQGNYKVSKKKGKDKETYKEIADILIDNINIDKQKDFSDFFESGSTDRISDEKLNIEAKKAKKGEKNTLGTKVVDESVSQNFEKLEIKISNTIQNEAKNKNIMKKFFMLFMICYFSLVTLAVIVIVLLPWIHDKVKEVLLGGFFTNLVGLLIIIFKYVFSPSEDLQNFFLKLDDRTNLHK